MLVEDVFRFPCSTRKCGYVFEVNISSSGGGTRDVTCPFCFSRYEINLIDQEKLKQSVTDYLATVNNAFSSDPDSVKVLEQIRSMGISINMALSVGLKVEPPKKLRLKIKDGKILGRTFSRSDRRLFKRMKIKYE